MKFYQTYCLDDDGHVEGQKFYKERENAVNELAILRQKRNEDSYIMYVPGEPLEVCFEEDKER